jgi:hypothetical protein
VNETLSKIILPVSVTGEGVRRQEVIRACLSVELKAATLRTDDDPAVFDYATGRSAAPEAAACGIRWRQRPESNTNRISRGSRRRDTALLVAWRGVA